MSNVSLLPGSPVPDGAPVPVAVELLEELLEMAKREDVRSLAVAWTDNTPVVFTKWAHNHEYFKLQGAVAQLLHRMCE